MISKSIFIKSLTNSLSLVRSISFTAPSLTRPSKSGCKEESSFKNLCFALAKPKDTRKVVEFVEQNFISKNPLIKCLFPCESPPEEIKRFHIDEVNCPSFTILARKSCDNKIVGIAVNTILKKDEDRICKYMKLAKCNHNLKKYFQVLSQLYQTPMMHRQLKVNEIVKVKPSICAETSPDVIKNLIQMSFNVAKSKGFDYASIHSTTAQTRCAADSLKCDRFWSKCYHDVLTQQNFKPPSFPKPPNDALSVHVKNLNEMC